MIFLRLILICIAGYLVIKSFINYGKEEPHPTIKKDKGSDKKISRNLGEYVDYEEIKKKDPDKLN